MNANLNLDVDFPEQLYALLREAPAGISEYALIQQLKTNHCAYIPQLPLTNKLVLFRTHFLLFNALYQLRDRLLEAREQHLQINTLCIQLLPYSSGTAELCEQDPLRSYYLDMSQLGDTSERDVERLLQSFWTRMQGGEEKQAALQLFELSEQPSSGLNLSTIKQRYRQLVSIHHPDRGGSTSRLQSINTAMEILQRYYK